MNITINDIIQSKRVSDDVLRNDIKKLLEYSADDNKQKLCGNKFLYHFQIHNLLETKLLKHPLLKDILSNDEKKKQFLEQVKKRNRKGNLALCIFECYRVNCGSVVFFKSSVAKYIFKLLGATSILDPCAGWGGRMLGAFANNIKYTGIDTNINLKQPYNEMINKLNEFGYDTSQLNMIWKSWKDVDFKDYDCVLTSPPYYNIEVYQNMTAFNNEDEYYKDFLIEMIDKCRKHITKDGNVCINVSQSIYKKLITKYNYEECNSTILMPKNVNNEKKREYIYIWKWRVYEC